MKTIKGRIIRIIDDETVLINLGSAAGIDETSVFSILADPEEVRDPFSNEVLGTVSIVKGRVMADKVSERFTIAVSKWHRTHTSVALFPGARDLTSKWLGVEHITDEQDDKLRVDRTDLRPWRAQAEDYVRVGDEVEVTVKSVESDNSTRLLNDSENSADQPSDDDTTMASSE